MARGFRLHPEAQREISESADYYLDHASPEIGEAFLLEVDAARKSLVEDPQRWRVVEPPEIRRCVLKRFPFVIYYRIESDSIVVIYAVMHCSRKPDYWRDRLDD